MNEQIVGRGVVVVGLDRRGFDAGLVAMQATSKSKFAKFGAVASKGLLAVGVAAGIVGVKAVKLEAEFTKTMNQVAAATGAPKRELKGLSDLAIRMGRDTVFSANDASKAMLELAKGGMTTAQIKGGALGSTLKLAAAGGLEMGDAANTMVRAMGAFNLKAKDSAQVANALAGAANASSSDVGELALALAQGGLAARNAGLSIQETTGVLGLFADAGVRGSDAGTSLKTFLTRLVPTTNKAKASMQELGLVTEQGRNRFLKANGEFKSAAQISRVLNNATKNLSDSEKTRYLGMIFGSDAQRAATVLADAGAKGLRKYIRATNDQGAAQRMANAQMKGTRGALELLSGSFETVMLQLGILIRPAVVGGIGLLTDALNGIGTALTWLTNNGGDFVRGFVDRIRGAFGGAGKGGGLSSVINNFKDIWRGLGDIVRLALESATLFVKRFVSVVQWIWRNFGDNIIAHAKASWEIISGVIRGAVNIIRGIFNVFAGILTLDWDRTWKGLKQIVDGVWDGIFAVVKGALKILWNLVKVGWKLIWKAIKGTLGLIWKGIKAAWHSFTTQITKELGQARDRIVNVWNAIAGFFKRVFGAIGRLVRNAWNAYVKIVRTGLGVLWDLIRRVFGNIRDFFKQVWDRIGDIVRRAWDAIRDRTRQAVQAVFDRVRNGWNNVRDTTVRIFTGVKDFFSRIFTRTIPNIFRAAVRTLGSIWAGIKEKMSGPVDWVINNVINRLIRAVNWVAGKLGMDFKINPIGSGGGGGGSPAPQKVARQTTLRPRRRAMGGVLPGYTPGRDVHRFSSPTGGELHLSGGEAVMRPEFTRMVGGPRGVNRLNKLARKLHGKHSRFFLGGTIPTIASQITRHSGYSWTKWAGDLNDPGSADQGDPVRAWKQGVVSLVRRITTSYGNYIRVNHAGNEQTLYAHLSRILVGEGQKVRAGQMIGRVGAVGNASGPHLHFELMGGNTSVGSGGSGGGMFGGFDPMSWITDKVKSIASGLLDKLPGGGWAGMIGNGVFKLMSGWVENFVSAKSAVAGAGSVGGGVKKWSSVVLRVLRELGMSKSLLGPVLQRMQQESGGNPRAINNWDSNAKNGDPSRGLMQTIGATFNAYAGKYRNRGIYDPLANIYAALRYARSRYGDVRSAMLQPGGYDLGGIANGKGVMLKRTLAPERVLSPRQTAAFEDWMARGGRGRGGGGGGGIPDKVELIVEGRRFSAFLRGIADDAVEDAMDFADRRGRMG